MTANKIRPVQSTAPEHIFLQGGSQLPAGIKFSDLREVTWCRDDADGAGIPYVRADLAGTTPAAVAGPAREEIAVLRAEHGITSNGRGIKEFEQVDAFVRAVLQRWGAAPALEAPAAPASDMELIIAALEHGKPQMAHYPEPRERHAQALAAARRLAAAPQAPAAPAAFQQRVQPWLMECFGPVISADKQERNHRFLEEALETVQAAGCTASEAHQLVDYVFGRPVGELGQEVGGAMTTLAALCLANGIDMHAEAEKELARVWTMVEKIRAKQAAKPKHSPLPAAPAAPAVDASEAVAEIHLLEEVCALYANDEDRYLAGKGEAYGSIPTEAGMKARAARKRFKAREAAAQAAAKGAAS